MTEQDFIGKTIEDTEGNTYIVQPTKKKESKYSLYLDNLTTNDFVSTLFIKENRTRYTIFQFNQFDLSMNSKRFYFILWDNEKDYPIMREQEKQRQPLTREEIDKELERRKERQKRRNKTMNSS